MKILQTINENESILNGISEIMSSTDSKKKKARRLKELRDNCYSELANAHIEYYIEAMRKERNKKVQRIVLALFSLTYLAFTLCRVWWYHHPESNHFPETNYTVADVLQAVYLITIAGAVLWGVRKVVFYLFKKKKRKRN